MIAHASDAGTLAVASPAPSPRRPRPRRAVAPRIVLSSQRLNAEGEPDPAGDEIRALTVASGALGRHTIVMEIKEDYSHDPDCYWLDIEARECNFMSHLGEHVTAAQIDFIAEQFLALRSQARAIGILPAPASTPTMTVKVGRYEDCAAPDWPVGTAPRFAEVADQQAGVVAIVSQAGSYEPQPTECNLMVGYGKDSISATVPFAAVDRLIAALITARDRALAEGILPQDGAK